ncbi:MAG: hypothetical protein ACXVDW_18800 [Bacteroidia bacterium]
MAAINQKLMNIINKLELVYDKNSNKSYIKDYSTYDGGVVCRGINETSTNGYILKFINDADKDIFINRSQEKEVNKILQHKAKHEGKVRRVYKRFGYVNKKVYVNIGNGCSLIIAKDDIKKVKNKNVCFVEHNNISPIDKFDIENGDIDLLRKYFVVNDDEFILVVVFMINTFFHKNPQLILNITGAPGSIKSSVVKMIKKILDPSIITIQNPPVNSKDLIVSAGNSYLLGFDNVSKLHEDIQNIFCNITTGGVSADRALTTDGDQYIIKTKNPILLTSINCSFMRQDVLQRTIIVQNHPISKEQRKTEESVKLEFRKDLPKIRGGLYRIVKGVLSIKEQFEGVKELTRMADFDRLGQMVEKVIEWPEGSFKAAYDLNLSIAQSSLIEESELAQAIIIFTQTQDFRGTFSDFGKELNRISLIKITTPRKLSADIDKVSDALYALHGIKVERLNRAGGKNIVSVSRVNLLSNN